MALRRKFTTLLGTLLLASAGLSFGIFGCSKDSESSTKANHKTITILWAKWAPADALQKLSEEFTANTGIKVQVEQKNWADISQTKDTEFNNNSTTYDLIIGDSQWLGQGVVGNHYEELTGFVAKHADLFKDVSPAAMQYYAEYPAGMRRYYAVPCEADAIAVAYRKDLFNDPQHQLAFKKFLLTLPHGALLKYNLEVPKTWEHLLFIARYFKEASGIKNMAGVMLPTTTAYDQVTMAFEPILWSFGGEWGSYKLLNPDVDSPANLQALQFMKQLVEASSEGGKNADYGDITATYVSGKTAMAISFLNFFPPLVSKKENPDYADQTGFFNVPAGPKGRYTALGGQGLSLNAHISEERKTQALSYLEWFSKLETQQKWAKLGGFTANNVVLASPEFKNAAPYNPLFETAFGMMLDFWNIPEYDQLLTSSQQELSAVLQGKKEPEDALKAIQAAHVRILAKIKK